MKNSKNDRKEFVQIGSIINSLLGSYQKAPASSSGKLNRISDVWPVVTGTAIADNTKPTALRGNLLLVNVTSSVWLQQLQYIKEDLIIRLNGTLGGDDIDNIKFKIGKI